MATSQSLQYLAESTYKEMRQDLSDDEDRLFEMAAREFISYCCIESASYDLVIKDSSYNVPRFCIHGAEIVNHRLEVYTSESQQIGFITTHREIIAL